MASVASLATRLSVSERLLISLLDAGDAEWRQRQVLTGGKLRTLLLPSRRLATVQQVILKRPLEALRIHDASFCVRRRGALRAAEKHARHPYLLHLDIKDFFPSVSPGQVTESLKARGESHQLSPLIAQLTTAYGQLPQGACTSVALANLVLYRLDVRLSNLCRKEGVTYTRYVDDLAVSGGQRVSRLEPLVRKIVGEEGWVLGKKGGLYDGDSQHRYLGIILNAKPNIDRAYIDDLRFVLTQLRRGTALDASQRTRLLGRIEYVKSVNSEVGTRLATRFKEASSTDAH